jgi:glycosyltransferase involved in cell wall biosynthesis
MKILILSNSLNLNSGFSRVAKALIFGLKRLGHDIYFVGMQSAYTPQIYDGIEMLPLVSSSFDELTQYQVILARTKPDVAIGIFQSDGGAGPGLENFLLAFKKSIWYTVVEGNYLGSACRSGLKKVIANGGKIVLPSLHGQEQCKIDGIDVDVIPYGYDPKIFYKTENNDVGKCIGSEATVSIGIWNKEHKNWEQDSIKVSELRKYRGFDKKFIFGTVKQNVGVRHRMERLIKAFSIFISESRQIKDNVMLHLHTMPVAYNGMDLMDVIRRIELEGSCGTGGVAENVIFSYGDYRSSGWRDTGLNELYNTFGCYCSASSGEGFGLPTLEAMACGIPVVGPRSSAFMELIDDICPGMGPRGLLCDGIYQRIEDGSERFLADEKDLARGMRKIYKDKKLREDFGRNCISFVRGFTWDKQIEKWDKYLKDFVGK